MTRIAILGLFALCALGAQAGEDVQFSTLDSDADGVISEREYVSWKTSLGEASPADALIGFIAIDVDSSGDITEAELEAAKVAFDPKNENSKDQM
ncbi:MAG: hypothetical protein ACX94D_00525 [Henriciella sp.]